MENSSPRKQTKPETTALTQLKSLSKVVADSGDFNEIEKYHPEDSTTNPSLLLQVASKPEFAYLAESSIKYALDNFERHCVPKKRATRNKKKPEETQPTKAVNYAELTFQQQEDLEKLIVDHLSVSFGCEILKKIPGYISTEVDAALSFDKDATVERARRIIELYEENGVSKDRVLIKIASTWEGIKAAEVLKRDKVRCNMTLIFNKAQAIRCAQSELFLISPFVGRILDWFKKANPTKDYTGKEDPGVKSVTDIYNHFKKFGYSTIIMGASFRNTSEILELAGCDRLTISPALLKELEEMKDCHVEQKLSAESALKMDLTDAEVTEPSFRYHMNNDAMATEKLSEGIRKFDEDGKKLREILRSKIAGVSQSA